MALPTPVKTYFVRNRRININSFGTEKYQNSKHNFVGMSETSKNGVFQARRRRKIFEVPDFLSFAPPLVIGSKITRGGKRQTYGVIISSKQFVSAAA